MKEFEIFKKVVRLPGAEGWLAISAGVPLIGFGTLAMIGSLRFEPLISEPTATPILRYRESVLGTPRANIGPQLLMPTPTPAPFGSYTNNPATPTALPGTSGLK